MEGFNAFVAVTEILQSYFDGLYHADTKRLAKVFHPDARYINLIDGDYMNKFFAEYFEVVDRRTPPANSDPPREIDLPTRYNARVLGNDFPSKWSGEIDGLRASLGDGSAQWRAALAAGDWASLGEALASTHADQFEKNSIKFE